MYRYILILSFAALCNAQDPQLSRAIVKQNKNQIQELLQNQKPPQKTQTDLDGTMKSPLAFAASGHMREYISDETLKQIATCYKNNKHISKKEDLRHKLDMVNEVKAELSTSDYPENIDNMRFDFFRMWQIKHTKNLIKELFDIDIDKKA